MAVNYKIAEFFWITRWWILALMVTITLLAIWQSRSLHIDNSPSSWFIENDPSVESYRNFTEWFGSDDAVVVTFSDDQGFITSEGYLFLETATQALKNLDDVERVVSLPEIDNRGLIKILFETIGVDGLNAATKNFPLASRLFSEDGETVALIVQFKKQADPTDTSQIQISHLEKVLEDLGKSHRKAGFRIIYATLNKLTETDIRKLYLFNFLLVFLVIFFFFRSYRPVLISLIAASVGIAWFLGLYTSMGRSMNVVTMVIPTVIMTIGVVNCVHLLASIYRLPNDLAYRERVIKGIANMLWPCLLSSLTTAIGFFSLTVSDLRMISDLGVFCATGILCVFFISVSACTFAGQGGFKLKQKSSRGLESLVLSLVTIGAKRPTLVLTTFTLLVAAAGVMATRVEIDAHPIDLLFSDHEVRRDSQFIEDTLGPYTPLEFIVRTDSEILNAETIVAISQWQQAAEELEAIAWSRSIVKGIDYFIKRSTRSESDRPASSYQPEDIQTAVDWYRNLPGSDYAQLVKTPNALRVTFGTYNQSARQLGLTIDQILSLGSFPGNVTVEASGLLPIWIAQVNNILRSQISSFSLSFVLIFSLIALILRSWKLSLAALPVNLLPVLVALATMGVFGIRLDLGTVAVASVILGLVVDDTIHFFYRLRGELQQKRSIEEALTITATVVGKPIFITSCALLAGFTVLALGSVKTVIWFGLLISLSIVTALIADLILAPALITLLKPKFSARHH